MVLSEICCICFTQIFHCTLGCMDLLLCNSEIFDSTVILVSKKRTELNEENNNLFTGKDKL